MFEADADRSIGGWNILRGSGIREGVGGAKAADRLPPGSG